MKHLCFRLVTFFLTCKTLPTNLMLGYNKSLVNLFKNAFYFATFIRV